MIYVATCPECGIFTRVDDNQPYACCGCRVPYTLVPDGEPAPVEVPDVAA